MRRVGINAIMLNRWSGGLGVYLRYLIDYLLTEQLTFKPVIFTASDFMAAKWQDSGAVVTLPVQSFRPVARIAREALLWRVFLRRYEIDLFLSPLSYIPFGVNVPTAVTIHDLRWFHLSHVCSPLRQLYLRAMIRRSASRACHILTVSEFSRQDIITLFGVPETRVSAIHEGFDPEPFQRRPAPGSWEVVRQRYAIGEPYILAVGHLEPHKNFVRLLQAFRCLVDKGRQDWYLVIVGKRSWGAGEVERVVDRLDLRRRVVITGFVPDEDLPTIYCHAQAFVAPSLFEGFGFTPLESMAAGVPVAAARSTSLPEIVGDAAVLFDPYDANDMAEAVARLLEDEALRRTLVQRGYQNLRRFDWRTCCARTAELLGHLAEEAKTLCH
ncbi:MAG: glycosyltransferase family 4 protein [Candidatus Oleimicrobiaceae bacterium]